MAPKRGQTDVESPHGIHVPAFAMVRAGIAIVSTVVCHVMKVVQGSEDVS
jgi:hypothetical protein